MINKSTSFCTLSAFILKVMPPKARKKRKAVEFTNNQVYKSISHNSGEGGSEFCQQHSRSVSVGALTLTKREYSGKKKMGCRLERRKAKTSKTSRVKKSVPHTPELGKRWPFPQDHQGKT